MKQKRRYTKKHPQKRKYTKKHPKFFKKMKTETFTEEVKAPTPTTGTYGGIYRSSALEDSENEVRLWKEAFRALAQLL